jgi:hypothetical protein
MRFVILLLLAASLTFAAAAEHYRFTLDQSYSAHGQTLKPGNYKLVIEGDHATLMQGSEDVLTDIKVETNSSKYKNTTMRSSQAGGMASSQPILKEIDLGGTHKKLIFD